MYSNFVDLYVEFIKFVFYWPNVNSFNISELVSSATSFDISGVQISLEKNPTNLFFF